MRIFSTVHLPEWILVLADCCAAYCISGTFRCKNYFHAQLMKQKLKTQNVKSRNCAVNIFSDSTKKREILDAY